VNSSSHEGRGHLTDVEIAAYLDRTLTPSERDRVEDHLADCPDCRQHLLETKELLEQVRRPRKLAIGGALVAAVVLVLVIARPNASGTDQRPLMRGDAASESLIAYGPIGMPDRVGLRFVWGALPGAESYRLTVSRADAHAVWSSSGTDTVATLPDSVTLRASERYYWVADALLSDGTTRSTGLREFGVGR
jgi:anti-sigma factor RsiW